MRNRWFEKLLDWIGNDPMLALLVLVMTVAALAYSAILMITE